MSSLFYWLLVFRGNSKIPDFFFLYDIYLWHRQINARNINIIIILLSNEFLRSTFDTHVRNEKTVGGKALFYYVMPQERSVYV